MLPFEVGKRVRSQDAVQNHHGHQGDMRNNAGDGFPSVSQEGGATGGAVHVVHLRVGSVPRHCRD